MWSLDVSVAFFVYELSFYGMYGLWRLFMYFLLIGM